MSARLIRIALLTVAMLALQACALASRTEAQQPVQEPDPALLAEARDLLELDVHVITEIIGEFYAVRAAGTYGAADLERIRQRLSWWEEGMESQIYIYDEILELGFGLYTRPAIDEVTGAIVKINPRTRNLISEVLCLKREEVDGKVYEYWVIKAWGVSRPIRDIYFLVTEADALDQPRTVLTIDNTYLREYAVNDTYTMTFPENDLYVLLSLVAWNYPWAFPDSDLASREVIMTTERELIERPFDRRRPPQSKRVMTPEEVKEYFGVQ